ncbi:MAG: class I SAM-dependent methyltransferase [Candidatus Aenigmarchaeota archaeon]|nr:class I SAM-dependent methyltransferase [Candidatus Aenigmarchaeota archaeon]
MLDKRLSPNYSNKMLFARKHLDGCRSVLDVGCGQGDYFPMYMEMNVKYCGIDIDPRVAKGNERIKVASSERIPFGDNEFDAIVIMDVIEHVADDIKSISEIHRVLSPKGKLIISVPNARFPFTYDPVNGFLRFFGRHIPIGAWSWGHRRLYRREEITRLVESSGFEILGVEEVTHAFVSSFISYIPYMMMHAVSPLLKKLGLRKSEIKVEEKKKISGPISRIYGFLNHIDRKYFSKTHGTTICIYAVKK